MHDAARDRFDELVTDATQPPAHRQDFDERLAAGLRTADEERGTKTRSGRRGFLARRWPLVAAAVLAAGAAVYAILFLWPGVPGTRLALPPSAVALVRLHLQPVLSWAPRAETRFFFQDGMVYWAELPWTEKGGARIYVYDPSTGAVNGERRIEAALAGNHVSDLAVGGSHVGALTWKVFWRGAEGTDGFRGLLSEPLLAGELSGGELKTVGPESLAVIANGGILSRLALQATPDLLVWHDLRMTAGKLPPEGGELLPEVKQGRDQGVWAHVFATGRTYRLPDYPGRHLDEMPALFGPTAYWPSKRRPKESGPIVAFDVASRTRSTVPMSENAATFGQPWQNSIAADGNVVVWTAAGESGPTLRGYDARTNRSLPGISANAVVSRPAVAGDFVVWIDQRRGRRAWDVYGLDLRTAREFLIAEDQIAKSRLGIDGDSVFWVNDRYSSASEGTQMTLYGASLHRDGDQVRVESLVPALQR